MVFSVFLDPNPHPSKYAMWGFLVRYLKSKIFSYIWSSLGPESAATLVHVQCIQLMTLAYSQKYLFLDIIGLLPEMKLLTDILC